MKRKPRVARRDRFSALGDALARYLRTDGWRTVIIQRDSVVSSSEQLVYQIVVQFTGRRLRRSRRRVTL